jgi:hypothetical protein
VDENVCTPDQLVQGVAPPLVCEVEHDASLAAVHCEEERPHQGVTLWQEVASDVADRPLDLDHVGAELGEHHRADRSHEEAR